MLARMAFKVSLIYSDKIDELAVVRYGFLDLLQIESKNGWKDTIDSHKYFDTGRPWKLLDEWYEE